ncbi:holo-ACP synthase [Candidatus Neomarinimicrobiota bacterium]
MIHLGTDIVEVERIAQLIKSWQGRFLERIYTPEEIGYCQKQTSPQIHFAGRFAAKEAVKKAVYSAGYDTPIAFNQIKITRTAQGAPLVKVMNLSELDIKISISHTANNAVATAVVVNHEARS